MNNKSYVFSVFLLLVIFFLFPSSILLAQTGLLKGDVTRDGTIDGRDALRILQHIEGVITLSDDQVQQGDVYPLPDGNGASGGDGILSQDDALTILRIGVGLITAGDISNNFNESPPVIDDFEPQSAISGETITITGSNFPTAHPTETILLIGSLPVEILSIENNAIKFLIPEIAQSGILRLFTPGGVAESSNPLFILTGTPGVLKLEENSNLKDFMVFTPYDAVEIENTNGLFTLHLPLDTMVLIGASSSAENRPGIYLYLRLPDEAASTQPFQIDEYSTAKALVFFHPFLSTRDTNSARYLFNLMEQTPEVQALADTIAQRYPLGADGLDDPEVGTAWEKAASVILNKAIQNQAALVTQQSVSVKSPRRAASYTQSSNIANKINSTPAFQDSAKMVKPMAEDSGELPVKIYGIDALFIAPEYIPEKHGIKMKLDNYSPIDWVSTLYRLDTNDMPRGINESFLGMRNRGVRTTGYEISTVVPANQWTAKIDLLYFAVDWSINSILEKFVEGGNVLPLEEGAFNRLEDSVYLLHSFSGSLYTGLEHEKPDFKAIQALNTGNTMALYSTSINITIAAVDLWDLLTGESKRWTRAAMKKGIQNAVRKISQRLSNVSLETVTASDIIGILLEGTVEAVKGGLTSAPQGLITWSHKKLGEEAEEKLKQAQGKLQKSCLQCMSRANAVLGALDKISSFGRVAERLLGLIGRLINVYDFELSEAVSPLESHLIVVGDPFSPSAYSMAPTEGAPGTEVTILGYLFASKPEDNTVLFGNREAKVLSVDKREKLVVEVPQGLNYNYEQQISIETPAMMKAAIVPQKFKIKRIPYITSVTPLRVFSSVANDDPGPFAGMFSSISIKGSGLRSTTETPDRVFLDDLELTNLYITANEIQATLPPNLPSKNYLVTIVSPDNDDYRAIGPYIDIMGKPVAQKLSPAEARAGQYITITGYDFGSTTIAVKVGGVLSPEIKKVSDTEVIFRMPTVGKEGESLSVVVITPAGTSGNLSIKRAAGYEDTLAPGTERFIINVNSYKSGVDADGELTLDEAANIARGDIDPFAPPWDDKNEIWTHNFFQVKRYDDQGNPYYIWEEGDIEKEMKAGGLGLEQIEHYRIDRYHMDNGGTKSDKYFVKTESLDEEGSKEEGDFVSSLYTGEYSGGQGYADRIQISDDIDGNSTFHAVDLVLTDYDSLILPHESLLSLGGRGIQITKGSLIDIGKVVCETGDALTITGIKNDVNLHILNSGANGIIMQEAVGNTIRGEVENCKEYGVKVEKGGDNRIFADIRNAGKHGILLDRSNQNRIGTSFDKQIIEGCGSHGIYIKESNQTRISETVVSENQGDGIVLENSSLCEFYSLQLAGNNSGLVLFGPNTVNNTISSVYIGYIDSNLKDNQTKKLIKMHNQYGVHLYGKASSNTLSGINIFQTGDHGMLIEDDGTTLNSFNHCSVGMPSEWLSLLNGDAIQWPAASAADGLVVQKGAKQNRFYRVDINHQTGNGIVLKDAGTDNNVFDSLQIGLYMESNKANKNLFKNGGWGAVVKEGPLNTLFTNCYGGYNEKGGFQVDSNQIDAPVDAHNTTFTFCYAGYTMDDNYKPKYYVEGLPTGVGFDLLNCSNVFVDRCNSWGYQYGLSISGALSVNNDIWSGLYRDAADAGILAFQLTSPNRIANSSFMECSKVGILVKECSDQTLLMCRSSGFNALKDNSVNLRIEKSQNIRVEDASFGNTLLNGVEIDNSNTISFLDLWTSQAGNHGVMITGESRKISLENCTVNENYGDGLHVVSSQDITFLSGRIDRNGLSGISFENVTNAQIVDAEINQNSNHGITISGENTENISVRGSSIASNTLNGIYALQGKGIHIGDALTGSEQKNYFECNEAAGIYAEGNGTQISIVNNKIGSGRYSSSYSYSSGNKTGIVLAKGIQSTLIQNNTITKNTGEGIILREGANRHYIVNNDIQQNGGHGVLVDGSDTIRNTITMNSISENGGKGIALVNGGNESLQAPIIDKVTWMGENIWGDASVPDGSSIEVYFDPDDEGLFVAGVGKVFKDRFNVAGGYDPSMKLHGIVIDPSGNTSEFGPTDIQPERSDSFVYTAEQNGGKDIYYKPSGNELPIQLTTHPAADYSPFASSDGSSILFVSERQGNPDLWLYNTKNGEESPLTTSTAAEIDPYLEPDGENLLYASNESGKFNIYRMPLSSNGSGNSVAFTDGPIDSGIAALKDSQYAIRILTEKAGVLDKISFFIQGDPAPFAWMVTDWNVSEPGETVFAEDIASPNETGWFEIDIEDLSLPADFAIHVKMLEDNKPVLGKAPAAMGMFSWTYFLSSLDSWNTLGMEIMLRADFLSSEPPRLTQNDGDNRQPAVSPEGNEIAYSSNSAGSFDIWIMDSNGLNPRKITDGKGSNTHPVWTSDSEKIVFASDRDGQSDLYQINADGSGLIRLTQNQGFDGDPAWSLDGKRILFTSDRDAGAEIYSMISGETRIERLTFSIDGVSQPHAAPSITIVTVNTKSMIVSKAAATDENLLNPMSAPTELYLEVSPAKAKPGETVKLSIQAVNAEKLGNVAFDVRFDPDLLNLSKMTLSSTFQSGSLHVMNPESLSDVNGILRWNWIHSFGASGDPEIMSLEFEIDGNADSETTYVKISNAHWFNADIYPLDIQPASIQVVIEKEETSIEQWFLYE